MQAEIDTHTLSFVAIAKAVKEKLASAEIEMVRWALPPETLALPPEVAENAIRKLVQALGPLNDSSSEATQVAVVRQVGITIAELGQATANNSGRPNSLPVTCAISVDILGSILLNLGGSRQLQGEVSERVQQFIQISCNQLGDAVAAPNADAVPGAAVLSNTRDHSLRDIFETVDQVLQRLDAEDAVQLLLGTLPDLPLMVAELHQERVSALLLRWRAKVHRVAENFTAAPTSTGDEAAIVTVAAATNDLLNIVAFLLNAQPMEVVLSCAQEWITQFFENATGRRSNINVDRLLGVMRAGLQHQLQHAPATDDGRHLFAAALEGVVPDAPSEPAAPPPSAGEVLHSLGVNMEALPEEAHEPLLLALDATGDTDEMFTCRPLVEEGKVSPGLACIVKHANRGGTMSTHVFVYDAEALREWVAQSNTVPETREDVGAETQIVDIS
jgi:hypothetical protein